MTCLNSMTIANAPPEKLTEMRQNFDEKIEQIIDSLEEQNYH